ncbi:hypothetical protein NW762_013604 [Fusarium torreyae]|uniref:Nephrocystin 3-like N-terminal domain-containing protein n=1 Tax=Fusarium torreyae TaxID=1237075 RepID=A0A9W8RPA7_9HYPO|nr:hypothetical protein NW762_013604 [Fusarium torreyae]
MDPITAFQVAGTVITFVEFTRTLLTEAREVYTSPSGTTSQSVRLDRIAQDLAAVGDQVSSSLANSHSTSRTTSEDTLLRLCGECNNIRNELQQALSSLQARGDTKFNYAVSSVATAFKAMWSQGKINRLDQRLRHIQSEMTMALLVSLWGEEKVHGKSRQKYIDEHMGKIEAIVNETDQKVNRLMERLVQITTNGTAEAVNKRSLLFEELWKTNWKPDSNMIPDPEILSENEEGTTMSLIQEHILHSLWFESIESRDQAIPETYRSTYEWIFHEDSETKFVNWLRNSEDPLYWITGKAGSGKSTLMKHIVHHPSTMMHLQHWADGSPVLFAHFYFWEATPDPLQHSREGLVRTLLWQCLKARPDLIAKVTPRRWAAYNALRGWEGSAPEWKWEELQDAFQNLASLNGTSFKLVMFIDGLDEFDGELETLLDWTKQATIGYGVKTCVGSRPWTAFSDTFAQYPTLTMQHLTAPDIDAYINGHFESSLAFKEWQTLSPSEAESLRESMSIKADGVFLWVYLVVRELVAAMAKGKSLHELHSIIDGLPTDILKLYTAISESVDVENARKAAVYFRLVDETPIPLYVKYLWFVEERTLLDSDEAKQAAIKILGRRLDSSTRGMLEVETFGSVQYHHRSVKEWLSLPQVSSAMAARLPRDFDVNLKLLEAHVGDFCNTIPRRKWLDFWFSLQLCLFHASRVVESPHSTPELIRLMETLRESCDLETKRLTAEDDPKFADLAIRTVGCNATKPNLIQYINRALSRNHRNDQNLGSTLERNDAYEVGHWSLSQDTLRDNAEDCFTGVAAQFVATPYVIAKVEQNKDLLKGKGDRRSLLHNAIFGWQMFRTVRAYVVRNEQHEARLKLVRALLDAGASPKGRIHLPFLDIRGGRLRDIDYIDAIRRLPSDQAAEVGPEEYWNEVERLLQERKRWHFGSRRR